MKIKHFALTTGIAIGATIASGTIDPASAFTVFLGEDVGANGNINAIPNSQAKAKELDFLSRLTSYQTEDFEGILAGSNTTTLVGIDATITTANSITSGVSNVPYGSPIPGFPNFTNSRFPISENQYYEVGTTNGVTTTKITFANPMAAFGFYATDIENQEGITLLLEGTNGINTPFVIPTQANGTSGAALYYGLIADNSTQQFNSLTFSLTTPVSNQNKLNDRFGIDNLTGASFAQIKPSTAVPEPFTIIGTLVGGTAAWRMRKKLKSTAKD
jgi:hypothetical protein